jgi:hypothetical protein
MSLGSSRDGDVEAWEGFAEDSADELVAHDDLIGLSIPPTLPPALRTAAVPLEETLTVPRDVMAERDIKASLDQSTTGTLSASRSSSSGGHASTAQNSIRDLRLSFPDPLTSSRDELNTTYEGASSSETTSEGDVAPPASTRAVDPGPSATPEVLNIVVSKYRRSVVRADLEIVLYGVSTAARWSVVDDILEKAAVGASITLTPPLKISEEYSRLLQIDGPREAIASFPKVVAVIDRTSDEFSHYPVGPNLILSTYSTTMNWRPEKYGRFQGPQPSLAIIFLPSMSSVSVKHTSYLPILVPRDNMSATSMDDHKRREDAESWSKASIRPDALFAVKQDAGSVIDIDDVSNIQPSRVHDALGCLMTRADDARRRLAESLRKTQTARDCDTSHLFRTAVTGCDVFFLPFSGMLIPLHLGVSLQLWQYCLSAFVCLRSSFRHLLRNRRAPDDLVSSLLRTSHRAPLLQIALLSYLRL